LSETGRSFIHELYQHVKQITKKSNEFTQKLNNPVKDKDEYKRLLTILGIEPIISAAILGNVNDPKVFKNGRQFAAWIGLTPSQYASGDTNRMGKMTKRGNQILRTLLIHGCKAIVALANKLASVLDKNKPFDVRLACCPHA